MRPLLLPWLPGLFLLLWLLHWWMPWLLQVPDWLQQRCREQLHSLLSK